MAPRSVHATGAAGRQARRSRESRRGRVRSVDAERERQYRFRYAHDP